MRRNENARERWVISACRRFDRVFPRGGTGMPSLAWCATTRYVRLFFLFSASSFRFCVSVFVICVCDLCGGVQVWRNKASRKHCSDRMRRCEQCISFFASSSFLCVLGIGGCCCHRVCVYAVLASVSSFVTWSLRLEALVCGARATFSVMCCCCAFGSSKRRYASMDVPHGCTDEMYATAPLRKHG